MILFWTMWFQQNNAIYHIIKEIIIDYFVIVLFLERNIKSYDLIPIKIFGKIERNAYANNLKFNAITEIIFMQICNEQNIKRMIIYKEPL